MRRYSPKYETLKEAATTKKINKKSNRMAQHYRCADCQKEYPLSDVNVDHIDPVVDPAIGFVDWNTYVSRMFCPKDGLQVLCGACHTIKTNKEKKVKSGSKKSIKD